MAPPTKVNHREFIRSLGKNIKRSATPELKAACRHAADAQDALVVAGKAGGLLPLVAAMFAAEYAEATWDTKIEEAEAFEDGAKKAADEWERAEDGSTYHHG